MRSRYAAYALGKIGYIIQTEHKNNQRTPKEMVAWRKDLKFFCQNTRFLGLQIVDEANLSEEQATVTFRAVLLQGGKDASFTERSLFERVNGRWFYLKPLHGKAWGKRDPILSDSPR
jgi:SEC-C motif-containing protein